MKFHKDILKLDAEKTIEQLTTTIKKQIRQDLKKSGAVLGISGGIDSSVCAALCAKALGPENVLGIMLPEKESSPDSKNLAEELAAQLGIKTLVNNIAPSLEGFGCYNMRDEAIKRVFPEYTPETHTNKITIGSNPLEKASLNFFSVVIEDKEGNVKSKRLPRNEYLQIVAASNLKQRSRMTHLYYHGERLNYAVIGTGQKDEHELGFFVKYGDGAADLKPLAHLYKLQVFQIAESLPIPKDILGRTPTTDTYSSEVTQTEFFYGSPFEVLDPCWYALENNIPQEEVAKVLELTVEQVDRVQKDIQQKIRGTNYLRREPMHIHE